MNINKFLLYILLIFNIFVFSPKLIYGLVWPIGTGTVQQRVTSTFGEYRDTSGSNEPYDDIHFHDGVDVYGLAGTAVYGVETVWNDIIWDINEDKEHVRTTFHDYFHINPENNLSIGDTAWYNVKLGVTIAGYNHVHFTSEIYNSVDPYWGHEKNPLLQSLGVYFALQPFSDTAYPVIHWIRLMEDETNTVLSPDSVAGNVDIVVKASDSTSYPDGVDTGNGVYTVSYKIEDYSDWTNNIVFDTAIINWHMNDVYAESSDISNYLYKATNWMNFNDYWWTDGYADGYYKVYVRVCDQSDNCVEDSMTVRVRNSTDVEEKEDLAGVPYRFSLSQNYPNPFNPDTRIDYSIPRDAKVKLCIYNVMGQRIKTLVDETKTPAYYDVVWDGRNDKGEEVATGTYLYKMETDDFKEVKKMILLK
ncbi:MAG: FlgD immunoglobulin-like domain containing protein [Candidatus Zixiibacteriota bacterium]